MQADTQNINTLSPLFDAMPDALVLINQEGEIVLINKQTELMFGYQKNELIGKTVSYLKKQTPKN